MALCFDSPLPSSLRNRGAIVGLICGGLCFPIAFLNVLAAWTPSGPPSVVLPIVFLSMIAGAVGCLFAGRDNEESQPGTAPRVGIRAGWIAALVGGATTVLAATVEMFFGGHRSLDSGPFALALSIVPAARPFAVLAIAILGIPPAIFFGMAGAVIAAMLRAGLLGRTEGTRSSSSSTRGIQSPLFFTVLLLSIVGYLSPVAVFLRPKPQPIAVTLPSTPSPIRPIVSSPPKWRYQKPSGFDSAEAAEMVVSEIRNLGEIDPLLPFALSPDERQFASFRRTGSFTLEIRDLDSAELVTHIDLTQAPSALAWSPDGTRIIVSTEGERRLGVIYVGRGNVVTLPQPAGTRIPQGRLVWFDPERVLLSGSGDPQVLHLDTLRIRPAKDSPDWNAISKDEQNRMASVRPHVPANSFRKLNFQPAALGYNPGADLGKLSRIEHLHVVFESPNTSYERALIPLDLNPEDLLLGTKDGTRFIRFRDRKATLFYLSLRDTPPLQFSLKMPGPPAESLSSKMKEKSLCVFICSPVINPLNGETVGPDRSRVKAIARVLKWDGSRAELWIAEDYQNVAPGDVASDLHAWVDGNPDYVSDFQKDEWFAVVGNLEHAPLPKRKDVASLDRGWEVSVETSGSADRLLGFNIKSSEKPRQTPAPPSTPRPPPATPVPVATPMPIATPIPQRVAVDNAAVIRRFMTEHSAKINRGDIESFTKDFTNPVEYLGNTNTRAEISNALRGGLARQKGYHETLVSMEVRQLSPTTFEVLTTVQHSNAEGRSQGKNPRQSLSYIVEITPSGPQITKFTDMGR